MSKTMHAIHHKKNNLDDIQKISLGKSLAKRLPWLILGLFGGLMAAEIIANFEKTLAENLILAAFIPLVVYLSDSVGTQMEAFAIRDLALHTHLKFRKYFIKQLSVVIVIAIVLSVLAFAISLFMYGDIGVSTVLAISLGVAILSSILTGLLIPYFFTKMNLDPANASGPMATIIQDVISVAIYFFLASLLLK